MSNSNIREMREEVRQFEKELRRVEERAITATRRLNTAYDVMMGIMALTNRMGLPDDLRAQTQQLQALIMVYRQLYASVQLFYAASGPVGWAMFAITATSTAVTIGSLKTAEV